MEVCQYNNCDSGGLIMLLDGEVVVHAHGGHIDCDSAGLI